MESVDVAVIGGGILGIAVARALLQVPGPSLVVLEAESELGLHQTGRNSGVIHSGLYYRPGSLKATLCGEGRVALYELCEARGIEHQRCGKLVVATHAREIPLLDGLERRGRANGLTGVRRVGAAEIREHEPHVAGIGGLFVPETGIVDFGRVTAALAEDVIGNGGDIRTGARLIAVERDARGYVLHHAAGDLRSRFLVNCAGLQSDRVARLCGVEPSVRVVPFRGEYYALRPERRGLVKNLVYPVPDPSLPFLGVHFTRMMNGSVEVGPNAVLALARNGYHRTSLRPADILEIVSWPGFWRMAAKHWRSGIAEQHRSWSPQAFVRAARTLVPEVGREDLSWARAGVRAQAVDRTGRLLDDFHLEETETAIHVLNAPSPAATAALAIAGRIAERATRRFSLGPAAWRVASRAGESGGVRG